MLNTNSYLFLIKYIHYYIFVILLNDAYYASFNNITKLNAHGDDVGPLDNSDQTKRNSDHGSDSPQIQRQRLSTR